MSRVVLCAFISQILLLSALGEAQSWVTYQNAPDYGEDRSQYTAVQYPIVAVAAKLKEAPYYASCSPSSYNPTYCHTCVLHSEDNEYYCSNPTTSGSTIFATDVIHSNVPTEGHKLVVILPNGAVRDLFPVAGVHNQLVDASIGKGSVVEPNNLHSVVEDGRYVIFGYFHDVSASGIPEKGAASYRGADLYIADIEPLKLNPDVPITEVPIRRLTSRTYSGSQQSFSERISNAINPALAADAWWGNVYMHAVDMMTAGGSKIVFVTDEVRVLNSNISMTNPQDAGHNFVLKTAELDISNWQLKNIKQFQYFTTTSVVSPAILRDGIATSYQATTQSALHWEIQSMNSEGVWKPLLGYGADPALYHLGSLCVREIDGVREDLFGAVAYYHLNNNGFGPLDFIKMSDQGVNELELRNLGAQLGKVWTQKGLYRVTQGVTERDYPSGKVGDLFIGKYSTPRCAGVNELYSAYTPTGANGRIKDAEYNFGVFRPYIVKSALVPFDPTDLDDPNRHKIVAKDVSNTYGLTYPTPIVTFKTKYQQEAQGYSPTISGSGAEIMPGLPYAIIGTSALYNTDVSAIECRANLPFDPGDTDTFYSNFSFNHGIIQSVASLRFLPNKMQSHWCDQPLPEQILGVSVHLTSNKTDMDAGQHAQAGYQTGGIADDSQLKQPIESKALLGVYDVRHLDGFTLPGTNKSDQSFKALIPANVPFDLCLLERKYGRCAADVRSWHSLKPREDRHNCGGCHNHRQDQGLPYRGSHADLNEAQDFVSKTPYIRYDTHCVPYIALSNSPTLRIPVWHNYSNPGVDDVFTGLVENCAACHGFSSGNPKFKFNENNPSGAYNAVRPFIVDHEAALGSPIFWYARGERTDGRDNNYYLGQGSYYFNPAHASLSDLCAGTQSETVTNWINRLGLWLDNHMPRDVQGKTETYHKDRYHPSVDGALSDALNCLPTEIRIGYWDDSGSLKRLELELNGASVATFTSALANGYKIVRLEDANNDDLIRVTAIDAADNRQRYEKSIEELVLECRAAQSDSSGDDDDDDNLGDDGGNSSSSSSSSSSSGGEGAPPPADDDAQTEISNLLIQLSAKLTVLRKDLKGLKAFDEEHPKEFKKKQKQLKGKINVTLGEIETISAALQAYAELAQSKDALSQYTCVTAELVRKALKSRKKLLYPKVKKKARVSIENFGSFVSTLQ